MNRDDVIRMAREAGFSQTEAYNGVDVFVGVDFDLERFAALVAKHTLANIDPSSFMTWQEGYAAGAAAEREACARWLEDVVDAPNWAEQIRARGNT